VLERTFQEPGPVLAPAAQSTEVALAAAAAVVVVAGMHFAEAAGTLAVVVEQADIQAGN
jgi:hypothetical protein